MNPASTASMQASSKAVEYLARAALLSNLALWARPATLTFNYVVSTSRPGKNTSNWVGASFLSLLVISVVSSDGSMSSLSLFI